jgi:hypothetical protein
MIIQTLLIIVGTCIATPTILAAIPGSTQSIRGSEGF